MGAMFPYSDYWWHPARQYLLTWISCVGMCMAALRYLYRRRGLVQRDPYYSFSRALAFYWPVYVWGIEALFTFIWNQFSSGSPRGAAGYIDFSRIGWGLLFGSGLIACFVVALGASLQFAFGKLLPSARGAAVGIPIPVFAAVLGVLGYQASVILLLLMEGERLEP